MSRPAGNAVPPKTDLAKDFVLQAYYQNFHHAHPIMLPLFLLRGPLGKRIPVPILQIMRYVGQHYQSGSKPSPPDGFIDNALSALDSSPPTEQNGFHVQGMILLAICAHAHGKRDLAISIIRKAAELALNLGMHTEAFIGSDAHDSPHIKEMWRRTYWELYVVDALLSALGGRVSSLYSPTSDVLLPCDQALTIEPNSEVITLPSFSSRLEILY
jgi:Fungal specific transcription factor domain